ncbi:MAG: hypothetical protein ABIK65_06210 [Candidatus Eisenbacteria bacterium]
MKLGKYTSALAKRGTHEPSFCYMMDSLLQSRIAIAQESNRDFFDEDVNVYLALLLNSVVSDRFHEVTSRYVAPREIDLAEIMEQTDNLYVKHEIYRVNGDFVLLQSGLFQVPREDQVTKLARAAANERGSTYYRLASSLADRIPPRYRPVSEVLAKLSYDFEKYRRILSHMRGEFLGLVEPIGDRDIRLLYENMEERERRSRAKFLQDELLDSYLDYQRNGSDENRGRVRRTLEALHALDPKAWPDLDVDRVGQG